MNVTLCSAFRNAESYLERYCQQVGLLAHELFIRGDALDCIWGEGDHTDNTRHVLEVASVFYDAEIVTVNHGQPEFGSVVHPIRFKCLAEVWAKIWSRIPQDTEVILFVESDIVWEPSVMLTLIAHLATCAAVAPLTMLRREGFGPDAHYDSWGYRKDGKHFRMYPPYFDGWSATEMTPVDSAGSCLVMRGEYARQTEWRDNDLIVGICQQIYELGGSVWLDSAQKVWHR